MTKTVLFSKQRKQADTVNPEIERSFLIAYRTLQAQITF